jgi:hypothetical protein
MGVVRFDGLAEVPVRRERAHHRLGVTRGQREVVAADDVAGIRGPALEDGRPEVTLSVDGPLAQLGAEDHRLSIPPLDGHLV